MGKKVVFDSDAFVNDLFFKMNDDFDKIVFIDQTIISVKVFIFMLLVAYKERGIVIEIRGKDLRKYIDSDRLKEKDYLSYVKDTLLRKPIYLAYKNFRGEDGILAYTEVVYESSKNRLVVFFNREFLEKVFFEYRYNQIDFEILKSFKSLQGLRLYLHLLNYKFVRQNRVKDEYEYLIEIFSVSRTQRELKIFKKMFMDRAIMEIRKTMEIVKSKGIKKGVIESISYTIDKKVSDKTYVITNFKFLE